MRQVSLDDALSDSISRRDFNWDTEMRRMMDTVKVRTTQGLLRLPRKASRNFPQDWFWVVPAETLIHLHDKIWPLRDYVCLQVSPKFNNEALRNASNLYWWIIWLHVHTCLLQVADWYGKPAAEIQKRRDRRLLYKGYLSTKVHARFAGWNLQLWQHGSTHGVVTHETQYSWVA